jgi:hypothetical protein
LAAPDIIEATLDGRQLPGLRREAMHQPFPLERKRQWRALLAHGAVEAQTASRDKLNLFPSLR